MLSFIASGRLQAATVSSLCAAASLRLPPFSYLSGAVIGVMTLRYGPTEGALMIAGSGSIGGVICWLLFGNATVVLAFAASIWVPVWLLAILLRVSASQGAMLAGAALLGCLLVLGLHVALGDAAPWWREVLGAAFFEGARQSGLELGETQIEQLRAVIEAVSTHMTGLVAAGTVMGLVITTLLARWWQAALDNPGGFGREFRVLRVPRRFSLFSAVIMTMAVVANSITGGVAGDLMWTIAAVFLLQGLAVVHCLVAGRARAGVWLFGIYLLLGFMPVQGVLIIAMLGYADEWLGLRRRFAVGAG